MTHEELMAEAEKLGRWEQHRFLLMVGVSIVIALLLVGVALGLYKSSGAAQLDLSRPGYVSVREQASKSTSFQGFPSTGSIDQAALDSFRKLYSSQAENVAHVDSFGGDVMSDAALSLGDPSTAQ